MNIHFAMIARSPRRISTMEAKAIGLETGQNTAATPRTRPGKTYPGRKGLRRALAKLAARRADRDSAISEFSRTRPTIVGTLKNIPGSMQA